MTNLKNDNSRKCVSEENIDNLKIKVKELIFQDIVVTRHIILIKIVVIKQVNGSLSSRKDTL